MVAGEGGVVIMIQVGLPVQQLVLLEEDFSVQMIGLVQCVEILIGQSAQSVTSAIPISLELVREV